MVVWRGTAPGSTPSTLIELARRGSQSNILVKTSSLYYFEAIFRAVNW